MGIIILVVFSFGIYAMFKKIASALTPSLFKKTDACGQSDQQPIASPWAVYDKPSILRCRGAFPPFKQKKGGRSRKLRSFAVQ